MPCMNLGSRWRMYERKPAVRVALFALGIFLMIVSPIVGALPGPGFIIVFPLGLGLTLKYSRWAKRRYVQFKRRWPTSGRRVDRLFLRRASPKRRDRKAAEVTDNLVDSFGVKDAALHKSKKN